MSIAEVMRPHPITVRPHHTVRSAAAVLLEHGIDAVPVVTAEGELRGTVDEVALIRSLSDGGEGCGATVADVITPAPPTVAPDDDVRRAVEALLDGARIVPVLDHGHLVGVIAARDLVRWFATHSTPDWAAEIPGRSAIYEAITRACAPIVA
jgi:CBS domain-containing protein